MRIDLNADVGEGCGDDAELLRIVTSANVACGAHAGDVGSMLATMRAAMASGAAIGAHPSFPDRERFGRVPLDRTAEEIVRDVTEQIRTLCDLAGTIGARVRHVKAHGALYNLAARNRTVADAISRAVRDWDSRLSLVGLAGGEQIESARKYGLRGVAEAFADRRYAADGSLVSRDRPDALIGDVETAVAQALQFARSGAAETICLHGDGPHAIPLARAIRAALEREGVLVRSVD